MTIAVDWDVKQLNSNKQKLFFAIKVNITIVYEHTLCATSAFIVCMLRVVLTSYCFGFSMTLQAVETYCLFLHHLVLKRVYILFIFISKEVL